jgi:hypothetical protein
MNQVEPLESETNEHQIQKNINENFPTHIDSNPSLIEHKRSISIESNELIKKQSLIDISKIEIRKSRRKKILNAIKIIQVVFARLILIGCLSCIIYFTVCSSGGDKIYYLIIVPIFIIAVEALYISIVRKGSDFCWLAKF